MNDPHNQGRREGQRVADVLQAMGWRRLMCGKILLLVVKVNSYLASRMMQQINTFSTILITLTVGYNVVS